MALFCFCSFPFSQFVMKNLLVVGCVLDTVALWEPDVNNLRESISLALKQAIIPLRAYAREYECHLELHNSDINTLLE